MPDDPATRSRALLPAGIIGALLALLLSLFSAGLPASAAQAAPPSGTYTGTSTAYTGATVSFQVEAGVMSGFETESYVQCGLFPTPMQWAGMPATQVTAGEPFDLSWDFGEGGSTVRYVLEGVVVNADGTASGEGYASMPELSCQGYRFTFTAQTEVQPEPTEPEPTTPEPTTPEPTTPEPTTEPTTPEPTTPEPTTPEPTTEPTTPEPTTEPTTPEPTTEPTTEPTPEPTTPEPTTEPTPEPICQPPSFWLLPAELTASELREDGVALLGECFTPGSTVTLLIDGQEQGQYSTGDADGGSVPGGFSHEYRGPLAPGTYELQMRSDAGEQDSATLTVLPDPDPDPEPTPEPTTEPTTPPTTEPTTPPTTEPTPEPTTEPTEPEPTTPAPTEPEPTEPEPTSTPTEPEPTTPEPTEPEPTTPGPTEPEPTTPAPTEPEPTSPEPTEPEPTTPGPTEPEPTQPGDEVSVEQVSGKPGDPIVVTGLQEYEGQTVSAELHSDPVDLGTALVQDGTAGFTVPEVAPGNHTLFVYDAAGDVLYEGPFEVLAAQVEQQLSVDPERITPEAFVDPDRGVTATATGFTAGETVTFTIAPDGEAVRGLSQTVPVDEDGTAAFVIYGDSPSDPSIYIGSYTVTVDGTDLSASFEVADDTSPPGPGGSGDDGSGGGSGGSLPRTGGEFAALGAGLALIALGGSALHLSRRRR
ncbi:hypothetical protein [Sediminivirga luteola]|uniref:LPXTG-motif cell wall-anchored protein n=1 Tax=Sediminivirga luteola TaxID=1774748 RepID=A0A8J2TZD6_9MICO|nr:hypothetical protein [Sediminivirga luteola]GGA19959.1 hypothetical protein GCM10011333_23860 [Sediminivirga luteola]